MKEVFARMHKAYDTILQSEVSAVLAARNGGFEPYRYECACCGEEVYVAAAQSTRMVAHFRHRSGNNDVECENYLGQYGVINIDSRSRRSKRERVEFYFDNRNKNFRLGLRFNSNEIKSYEQRNVDFEIRTMDSEVPLYTLPINSINFAPDVLTLISLTSFSYNYYLSNTLNGIKRKHGFLKSGNTPTFFKVQGNDNDFKAKLVRSDVLFTNVLYFVVFRIQYPPPQGILQSNEIVLSDRFRFETMGSKFLGMTLSILRKTARIDTLLKSWGYQLENSETLTLLWPPAPIIDDTSLVTLDNAFLFTSFELQAHGNINVHSEDIFKVNHRISRIFVKPKTKVCKKNVEIAIDKVEQANGAYNDLALHMSYSDCFRVPDDSSYFLFNRSGVIPLKSGQVVFLTPESMIKRYENNYLTNVICPCRQKKWTDGKLLNDILMHYKRMEELDLNLFASLELSDTSSQYINKCKASGAINSFVKQLIIEGLL